MNKYDLKNRAFLLQDNLDDGRNYIYFQWDFLALDIMECKIFKPLICRAKK